MKIIKKEPENGKKLKDDRVMLVMDDCMSSKGSWVKDENVLNYFLMEDTIIYHLF